MPPVGFRKRITSPRPPPMKKATPKRTKPTLFDAADLAGQSRSSLEENRKFLEDRDDDDQSSLSDIDSDEFEDVPPPAKRRKVAASKENESDDEGDDEEDGMEWEDAIQPESSIHATPSTAQPEPDITDLSISVNDDGTTYVEPLVSAATGKKGPSQRERTARIAAHCLHVQTLMWHNHVRNAWLNDEVVQKTLMDGLPEGVMREVRLWKDTMSSRNGGRTATKEQAKKGKKGKQKGKGRDWDAAAQHVETSDRAGDPLLRLLKVLASYWRKRFAVTAPGLRKQGYKSLKRLRDDIRGWKKDHSDFETYGERIENKEEFRELAKSCEGSRDVGAQLFVALLRGLGLETRMVANLQPIGFGFSKAEEAVEKKSKTLADKDQEDESDSDSDDAPVRAPAKKSNTAAKKAKSTLAKEKPSRKSARGIKSNPINLDDSDSPLSSAPSEVEDNAEKQDDDDLSVVDITPSIPKRKLTKKYDRDMGFPNYWTEVCSPVSGKYYPIDPIVLSTIASNDELLQTFEPRGKRAEKAKQVICYTIAFNADRTAKDVTVRYLKRHQLPGKTRGVRMPIQKVAIRNHKGKVKRYEEEDWFGWLMLRFNRPEDKRTAADDLEDRTDLKPYKPEKGEKQVSKESLAGYKQSADFVLEQHLRREEAILPEAEVVKYFTAGKGDKAQEVPVYRRDDIVSCKTVESWHKEGRAVKVGEQPLKYVPVRAVTLVRKREMEDVQRETGEKMKQGLYSQAQTDWIIPPPIENGVIPKNAFGNMDVYVETMVPKGAKHLPLKGSAKICKKLGIDFAEACTGFEFGAQRAVPILTGVVVAEENATMVKDAWRANREEEKRKEDTKRTATALHWWRKMLLGLRVIERMRVEYAGKGDAGADINPFVRKEKRPNTTRETEDTKMLADEDMAGGFFQPGHDEEEVPDRGHSHASRNGDEGGGFLVEDKMDIADDIGGGFLVEDEDNSITDTKTARSAKQPVSLQSMHKGPNGTADSESEPVTPRSLSHAGKSQSNGKATQGKLSTTKAKPKQSKSRRTQHVVSDDEEESPLSELSDDEESESVDVREESESDGVVTTPARTKHVSPKVIVPNGSRSSLRATKKVTPTRSQYFDHSPEDDASEDDEVEVIKPRKTTARTRARK